MKTLVTSGAGFIGSAVCRLLVGEFGATVLNVDKLTYAANLGSCARSRATCAMPFGESTSATGMP
jgi:dTDP-glucose 4,6-dehydratase